MSCVLTTSDSVLSIDLLADPDLSSDTRCNPQYPTPHSLQRRQRVDQVQPPHRVRVVPRAQRCHEATLEECLSSSFQPVRLRCLKKQREQGSDTARRI